MLPDMSDLITPSHQSIVDSRQGELGCQARADRPRANDNVTWHMSFFALFTFARDVRFHVNCFMTYIPQGRPVVLFNQS